MSYDDILRATVVEPDLSFRPTREEEELSRHRFGAQTEHRPHRLTHEERELLARVRTALASETTLDLSGVEIEVDGRQVVLSGTVPGPATKVRIEDVVVEVDGVDSVDNQLYVRRTGEWRVVGG